MKNKLAKLKYLPNNFEILEPGDHVICAVSSKIMLEVLLECRASGSLFFFYRGSIKKRKIKII